MDSEILQKFLSGENDLEGWFYPQDMISLVLLDQFHKAFNIRGEICEVGVFKGKSLSFFSHCIRDNEKLYGYDFFQEDYYECTEQALKKHGAEVNIELIKANTSELSIEDIRNKMNRKGIRILHIDAGHEYHEVLHSLLSFSPNVVDSGIIVMDDYQDPEFPGIESAVLDFCEIDRPKRFVPFYSGGNKIYLCSYQLASRYQIHMLTNPSLKNKSRLSIVRDFSILKGFSKLPTNFEVLIRQINDFELNKSDLFNNKISELSEYAKKYSQSVYGK